MAHVIDTRGLSCPQPVLMVNDFLKDPSQKSLQVLVDNEASKENVTRAAIKNGWKVNIAKQENDEVELELTR